MKVNAASLKLSKSKQKELESLLVGYWAQDTWKFGECPVQDGCKDYSYDRAIKFTCSSSTLNSELKYGCWQKLERGDWKTNTLWGKVGNIRDICNWINQSSMNIGSFVERDLATLEISFRSYLVEIGSFRFYKGINLDKEQKIREYVHDGDQINTLRQVYKVIQEFSDDRDEYDRDIWDIRKLGYSSNLSQPIHKLNFSKIVQPWIKSAAKKFIKYSLSTHSVSEAQNRLSKMGDFSIFLAYYYPDLEPSEINRELILEYLSQLSKTSLSSKTIRKHISCLNTFLELCAREGWADVPNQRLIYNEDYPRLSQNKPRFIPENVLSQLNEHLDKLPPHIMRMVMIIQECGMRISELCCLQFNCLSQDVHGDWFLLYYQFKMKKEHIIPISKEIVAVIQEQQEYVRQKRGQDCKYLFFSPKANRGDKPIKQAQFTKALNQVAYEQQIRDSSGNLWRFQAHQFRHTVGTRMINMGVPQHIIQRYLGHESPEMTNHYAHIHDQTLKEEFAKFKNKIVDIAGKVVEQENSISQNSEVQWIKKNILAQSLPNGSCALPVVAGQCPHANACLSCTHFRTTSEFLDEHKKQLKQTNKIIETAKANRWQRQVEMNEKVKQSLENIINSLEGDSNETPT